MELFTPTVLEKTSVPFPLLISVPAVKAPPERVVVPEEILLVKVPASTPVGAMVRAEAELIVAIAPLEKADGVAPFSQAKLFIS
jgi:hypothetical protein